MMRPYEPGTYLAREIHLDFTGQRMTTLPTRVKVVAGVPNERGHKLLVETGGTKPKYKGLDCYEWLSRVEETWTRGGGKGKDGASA